MKRISLLLAGAAIALSASAQWAVVGAYSDPSWNFEASAILAGTGDKLSCTIDKLTGDFKIVDITNNNWDIQYGTATPVEIGETYVLDGKNGGADPANIKFAGLIQEVNFATVTFNPTTFEMTITAEADDVVYGYPTLYFTGSNVSWSAPGEGASVKCEFNESTKIYTVKVDLGEGEENVEFKLAGPGWSNEIAGGVEITADEAAVVTNGGDNLFTALKGEQTLSFNISNMKMTFGDPSLVAGSEEDDNNGGETGAVSTVDVENAAPVYFTLQGVKVANPDKGIYIVKTGNKAAKVVF